MADTATAPLLTSHGAKLAKAPSIDDTIETYMGITGAAQLLKAVLLAFAWAFDAQQVFTDADPTWHCTGADASCSPASTSPCALPSGAWAWDRQAVTSVVSEWSLKCAGPALVSLPASSFFAGCLAGSFLLTTLADSLLGRRKMLLTSIVSMSVTGVVTAFSPNVWAYAALRFLSGFCRSMVGTCTMVLSTELVGKKWRDTVCVAGFFCFTLGFLSLPALAYTLRDASWRNMYLWTSVPSLCYSILIYFLIQESPRWLLVRGRKQDAIETLRQIERLNGNSITSSFSMLHACTMQEGAAGVSGGDGVFATLRTMWQRPWALRRLAAMMTVSFGVGTAYYGMPLNVGNLGSNLYLSVLYNALAELPSSILSWLLMGRINRRSSVIALSGAAGLCSLACVVIPQGAARMAAELLSFSATCTAFNVILMYSIELFPTSVRNSAVGLVRQALVLGGVAAPVLVALGRDRSFLSFGVFGLVIGCFGMFAACLPETRGKGMSDTMDEEEQKEAAVANCAVDDMDSTRSDLV
jgi:OCT family organic cation transporter-like MFS transporter 3